MLRYETWIKQKPKSLLKGENHEKKIWAYLDGKKLVEVIQASLDNNMTIDECKKLLNKENPDHEVTFKVA